MPSGKILELLIMAMEGLTTVDPRFKVMVPDETNYTTDPSGAVVVGSRIGFSP
jgi:hypothetical protein